MANTRRIEKAIEVLKAHGYVGAKIVTRNWKKATNDIPVPEPDEKTIQSFYVGKARYRYDGQTFRTVPELKIVYTDGYEESFHWTLLDYNKNDAFLRKVYDYKEGRHGVKVSDLKN